MHLNLIILGGVSYNSERCTSAICLFVCLMVFNATFNNISVISWRSVLLMEETGGPGENHRPVASHWQTLSHNVVHLALIEIRTHNMSGVINMYRVIFQEVHIFNICSFNIQRLITKTIIVRCYKIQVQSTTCNDKNRLFR